MLLILFAFLAGIVTVLSPCILPILPIILSGSFSGGKRRPFGIILGFVISFTFFTLFSFALVQTLGIPPDALRITAIALLALFGISLFVPQVQVYLEKLMSALAAKRTGQGQREGFGGGVLIGLSLGLLWTPCVGPILASVITLAATSSVTVLAALITLAYSIGTALPMLAIMYGGRQLLFKVPWITRNSGKIQKVFGGIMLLLALALAFNLDRQVQIFILDKFPQYGVGLTQFEQNEAVREHLQKLREEDSEAAVSGKDMATVQEEMREKMFPAAPNPDFEGATKWLNSEPLTLSALRGKVVLVDFWTYSCINCIRTFPYLTAWDQKYRDQGLVIIGVHSPEFQFEKDEGNVRQAMADFGITYPVVQDNDFKIWRSYENRFWPAEYFIDKNGNIRRMHFGEGEYDESEKMIQELLAETGAAVDADLLDLPADPPGHARTPETYLGYARLERFESPEKILPDATRNYSFSSDLSPDGFAFEGGWVVANEYAGPSPGAKLQLRFRGQEVYLVMRSSSPENVRVYLNGEPIAAAVSGSDVSGGMVTVSADRLYRLVELPEPQEHLLTLEFLGTGTEIYAFTFG